MKPVVETNFREICVNCLRPTSACWCKHVVKVATRTKVVFLQHPREHRVAIGTARMAHLSLPGSELHVGADFSGDARIAELSNDPNAALLFPGPDAQDLGNTPPEERPRTLVVVDGTWSNARKLVLRDPVLSKFRRVQFTPRHESRYRIRKEPNAQSVSTIEATVEALGLLEDAPDTYRTMLGAFEAMIDLQIEKRLSREGATRYGRHRKTVDPLRPARALVAHDSDLVLVASEADAHAGESAGRGSPRLIHLVAHRWRSGETFEVIVRPERPLGSRVHQHARLPREVIEAGTPVGEAIAQFREFLRPEDVLVAWGGFPYKLLERAGLTIPKRHDLRIAASEWLHKRPGMPGDVLEAAKGTKREAIGQGRAGASLGAMVGIVDAWARLVAG